MKQQSLRLSDVFSLFDDASVREKLKYMKKWDAMMDDERNATDCAWVEDSEAFIQLGRRYRVTITFTDIGAAKEEAK